MSKGCPESGWIRGGQEPKGNLRSKSQAGICRDFSGVQHSACHTARIQRVLNELADANGPTSH